MKEIKLTKGKVALVDDEDFEWLNKLSWYYNGGYAVRGCGKRILMHRVILNTPEGLVSDHINRNKLDNRRCNLRVASKSLNNFNTKTRIDNKSGIKGIHWNKVNKNWRSTINKDSKRIEIGSFVNLNDAIKARREAEKIHYAI